MSSNVWGPKVHEKIPSLQDLETELVTDAMWNLPQLMLDKYLLNWEQAWDKYHQNQYEHKWVN